MTGEVGEGDGDPLITKGPRKLRRHGRRSEVGVVATLEVG